MMDPKEAVVELELIGYRFSLKDGEIDYTYQRSTVYVVKISRTLGAIS